MKILKSYGYGVKRAVLEPKMIFVLWLINILFSSVIFFLFLKYLTAALGNSPAAEGLLKKFDFNIFFELIIHKGGPLQTIFYAAFILACLFFLVSIFLNGGILSVLISSHRSSEDQGEGRRFSRVFFQGAGQFFGRFFRLCIYSLILWIAVVLIHLLLNFALKPLTADGTNEKLMFYLILIQVAVGVFFVFLVHMILDYACIKIVIEDSRSVFRSLFQMTGFVFRRFGKTLALYYLLIMTGAGLCVIHWFIQKSIQTSSFLPILVAFTVGQVFILSRGWLKIAFQAAQLDYYSSNLEK